MKTRPPFRLSSITPTGWVYATLLSLSAGVIILAGCGGHTGVAGFTGSTATTTTAGSTGNTTGGGIVSNATLQIDWPARTRQLTTSLTSALSASITLKAASATDADVIMNVDRNSAPAAYTGTYTLTQAISPNATMLTASFYSQPAEAGTLVGTATASVSVAAGSVNLTQINVAGTIKTVTVNGNSAGQFELFAGQPAFQATCTALDVNSNVVPITPGSIAWSSNHPASFTITADGTLAAVALGQGTITAVVDSVTGGAGCFIVPPPTLEATSWSRYQGGIAGTGEGLHPVTLASQINTSFPTGQSADLGSPVVSASAAVYFGGTDGNVYELSSGLTPQGIITLGGSINSTPTIASSTANNETLYVGCDDNNLYAISTNLKQVTWKFQSGGKIDDGVNVGTDGTVYFAASDHALYAVTPWGSLKWKYQMGGSSSKLNLSSPSIDSNGTIYVGSTDGNLYAITSSGSLAWKYTTGGPIESSPSIDSSGNVYVGSDDMNLYALTPSGTLNWKSNLGTSLNSNQSVTSAPMILADPNFGRVIIDSTDGNIYAVSIVGSSIGSQVFKSTASTTTPLTGSPLLDSLNEILVATQDGNIYELNATGTLLHNLTGVTDSFVGSLALGSQGIYLPGYSSGRVYFAL